MFLEKNATLFFFHAEKT